MTIAVNNPADPLNIGWVSIGVSDMAAAEALWVEQFGLKIIDRRTGPDTELADLWGLVPTQISQQLLLGTPGAATGLLHFVEFSEPGGAVREAAASTDLGPKNLDVNCAGMPLLAEGLLASGYSFRSAIAEYEFDGIEVREVQMPVHDAVNVVLIEVLSAGFEVNYTQKGFAGLTSFVVIVPDVQREVAFYQHLFGMQTILSHALSGKAIEDAADLPAGTVLDLHLLGDPDNLFGRMELIEYTGINGANLFPRCTAPAAGILNCGFKTNAIKEFQQQAVAAGFAVTEHPGNRLIFGSGELLSLSSPAGFRLYIQSA